MGKLLALLSLVNLLLLELGTVAFPSNPAMWIASTSTTYMVIRGVLILLLVMLLVTNPPRHLFLRLVSGITALAVLLPVAVLTFAGTMPVLDSLALLSASIVMCIMALEIGHDDKYVDIEAFRQEKHGRMQAH